MIVITGANGFIGRNILKRFDVKEEIIAVDFSFENLSKEENRRKGNLYFFNPSEFLDLVNSGPSAISFVFHQGACTDTTCYDSKYMLETNYDYTYSLLNLCAKFNIPIVYASSASVYGDGPFSESDIKSPKNVYAKSKSMIDDYVEVLMQTTDSQITGLRYFNVYGPHEESKGKMSSVINQFKEQIDISGRIKIFENSDTYRRDFVFVEDIVDINYHFYEKSISGIFNCGSGEARKFTDIPKILKNYYDFDTIEIPMPESMVGKYQSYTKADVEKLRSQGCYTKEMTTLEEGIERYIRYWNRK